MFCDDKKTGIFIILFGLSLMNPFSAGSYLLFAVSVCFIIVCRHLKVDLTATILLLFAVSYFFFRIIHQNAEYSSAVRLFLFPACYLFGYQAAVRNRDIEEEQIIRILVFISLAFALHGFLNMFLMIATKGITGFGGGVYTDFWTREVTSSTGQAANYYFLFAISGFVFFGKYDLKLKILLIICEIIALAHCILCGVRMCLFIFIIVFLLSLFVSLYFRRDTRSFLKLLFISGFIIIAAVLIYQLNLFNIQSVYKSSYLYFRLHSQYSVGLLQDDRMARKAVYLQNVFRYPFGGQNLRVGAGVGYAHDLWLDTFDDVGVIPTVFLIIYTISLFIRLFKYSRLCSSINLTVICVSMLPTFAIVFFYEPIIDSYPLFLAALCMVDGLMKKRLYGGLKYKEEIG